ncbi:nuclear transport factor 2 family protein [Nonlabens marinus]|uniref:Ketosteroid isomerase-related protein n=1 Tax=Nonlabens marinus S1-08 TaxID=1454201 RepID=W8W0F0_9FLAO|nr:nuclear transport factor 2 family protein [Nonlabens marinus]BAO56211.1 ketosteroid isomerase-related protein [Nonlabens marinus S1-08]
METRQLLNKFYDSFAHGDAHGMIECYAPQIVFEDPVFGQLHGKRAECMWQMLLENKKRKPQISYRVLIYGADTAQVAWTATYFYGKSDRKVVNQVLASFDFKDGLIVHHRDNFNLWNWSRQALGISGFLIGWTNIMERKIQNKTRALLDTYIENSL